jgi:hypothetical protein
VVGGHCCSSGEAQAWRTPPPLRHGAGAPRHTPHTARHQRPHTCVLQGLHGGRARRGHVAERRAGRGGGHAGHVHVVLRAKGHAPQRAARAGRLRLQGSRAREQLLQAGQVDEDAARGRQARVQRAHERARARGAGRVRSGKRAQVQRGQLISSAARAAHCDGGGAGCGAGGRGAVQALRSWLWLSARRGSCVTGRHRRRECLQQMCPHTARSGADSV